MVTRNAHAAGMQLAFIVFLAPLLWHCAPQPKPELILERVVSGNVGHPSDLVRIDEGFAVTELLNDRVVILPAIDAGVTRVLPVDASFKLKSPHFLAISEDGGLIASEGWGSTVIEFADSDGREWRRIRGSEGDELNAPHGICVDDSGWIYIADSLNSRIVRTRGTAYESMQVLPDPQGVIGYGRQLRCRDGELWLANSYEKRERINPGTGSNVIRVRSFERGEIDIVFEFPHDGYNVTGLEIIDSRWIVLGFWVGVNRAVLVDTHTGEYQRLEHPGPEYGPPYGIWLDREENRLYVSYLGDIHNRTHKGGIAIYKLTWKS